MKIIKALSKQLLGAQYEGIAKSLLSCIIVFIAIYTAEIRINLAPSILYLTTFVISTGVMFQSLFSAHTAERMEGLFILPFNNREFVFSFVLAYSGYTLITKSMFVLTIFFAASEWEYIQIIIAMLCALNGCMMAAVWYSMLKNNKVRLALIWGVSILLFIFCVQKQKALLLSLVTNLVLVSVYLLSVNAYTFYHTISAKVVIKHGNRKGNMILYLLRYLIENKHYLVNTIGLWVIACILPFMLGQFKELNTVPIGLAILCLNTPICILLSCDINLEQAIRTLPKQAFFFGSYYCFFIFFINMMASMVYICSWQFQYGDITGMEISYVFLFAFQSAILSVLLEWLFPLRKWKTETDLWHHPRKYIVPLIMLLISVCVSAWSFSIGIWYIILFVEVIGLLSFTRRK